MRILLTGTAGFIGFHLTNKLIQAGHEVVGLDSINDYYDVNLKYARLGQSGIARENIEYNKLVVSSLFPSYRFVKMKLEDRENLHALFRQEQFECVCNLAAQAGVRYSLTNPYAYIDSNIIGFINILEACRHNQIRHLVYASSSSVYGLNEKIPFSESDNVDHPISLYAATKKSNELMAHTYSYLFGLPTTGLRFFTVYGPWGRPDMALFIFTKSILEDKPIQVYNNGEMARDFTYIDDIVEGISCVIESKPPEKNNKWTGIHPDPGTSKAPYVIFNIGKSSPVKLMDFIMAIENILGKKAKIEMMPMQPGDVAATFADIGSISRNFAYEPKFSFEVGIRNYIEWYKSYKSD